MTNDLDQRILGAIGKGKNPFHVRSVAVEAYPLALEQRVEANGVIEDRLQALRKQGLIRYSGRTNSYGRKGWQLIPTHP